MNTSTPQQRPGRSPADQPAATNLMAGAAGRLASQEPGSTMICVVTGGSAPVLIAIVCVPGVSGRRGATQPWPTDSPVVPAGSAKRLSLGRVIGRRGVSASVTCTGSPSRVTMDLVGLFTRAQARSSASVLPFPSNVLHSYE